MGFLSSGSSARSRTRKAYGKTLGHIDESSRLLQEGTGLVQERLAPMDVGGDIINQLMIESGMREGDSRFEMNPAFQAMQEEKNRSVQQNLMNAGMGFSGEGISQVGEASAGMTGQAYGNYMNQLNNLMGIGQATTTDLANLQMSETGGLRDLEMAKAEAYQQRQQGMNAISQSGKNMLMGGLGMGAQMLSAKMMPAPVTNFYGAAPAGG